MFESTPATFGEDTELVVTGQGMDLSINRVGFPPQLKHRRLQAFTAVGRLAVQAVVSLV